MSLKSPMAVLSDQEIWNLLQAGRLKIDPPPAFDAVAPSAIDLRLGNVFTRLTTQSKAVSTTIDTRVTKDVMAALAELGKEETVTDGGSFDLQPKEFALAWTQETVGLPNFLAARVEGRSTLARLGLSVHQSAPTVHATFTNPLRLELFNAGPYTLKLYPGQPICQLIVEKMSLPATGTLQSVHQGTTGSS
jgi:dCTP deaminase